MVKGVKYEMFNYALHLAAIPEGDKSVQHTLDLFILAV